MAASKPTSPQSLASPIDSGVANVAAYPTTPKRKRFGDYATSSPMSQGSQASDKSPRKKRKAIEPNQRNLGEWGFTNNTASSTPSGATIGTQPLPSPSLSPKSSPTKGKKKGKAKDDLAPVVSDEELRRAESLVIDPDQMINKKNLRHCYRLTEKYIQDVPLIGVQYEDRRISAKTVIDNAKTNLYRERDAEFQAWKMHGGREPFLKFLYESYLEWDRQRKGEEKFPIPNSYEDAFKRVWDELEPNAEYRPNYHTVWTAVTGEYVPVYGPSSQKLSSTNNIAGPSSQSPTKEKDS